jgi:hypothetical protein
MRCGAVMGRFLDFDLRLVVQASGLDKSIGTCDTYKADCESGRVSARTDAAKFSRSIARVQARTLRTTWLNLLTLLLHGTFAESTVAGVFFHSMSF